MLNNYLMNNNLIRDERLFIEGEEEMKMARGISENPEDNLIPQIFLKIKEDLDEINYLSISDNIRQIKANSLDEIRKITNNSKYLTHIEEILNKDTESLEEHFNLIQASIANKKMSILKTLSNGMEKIQEEKQLHPQGIFDPNNPNANMLNYVYDDEFVTLINSLSSAIKEFFKKSRSCFTTMKGVSEQMIEHLLNSKSSVTEALVHVNSMMITNAPKLQKTLKDTSTGKEKIVKDKISHLMEKLENLNESRVNFLKNLKSLEQNSARFYEDAKVLFKKMKETRNDKLEEYNLVSNSGGINNYNQTMNWNNIIPSNYNNNLRDTDGGFNNFKHKSMCDLLPNTQSRLPSNSPTARNRAMNNFATSANMNNIHAVGINNNSRWKNLFEDIEKEEKIIGDRIDSFKKRNQELTKDLEIFKKKFSELKVENISLKEKLQRSIYNSNYQSNFNSNQESKETNAKTKSASVDTKKLKENQMNLIENSTNNKTTNSHSNNISSKRSNSSSSNLKETPEQNKKTLPQYNNTKSPYQQVANVNQLKSSNENVKKEIAQIKNQLLNNNTTKPRIASAERKEKTITEKTILDQYKTSGNNSNSQSNKPNEFQRLYTIEEKTLAESVINFMSQMSQLQENIAKKSPTVSELKKDFEMKKRELIKYAEKINNNINKTESDFKLSQDNFNSNSNFHTTNTSRTNKMTVGIPRNKSMNSHNNSLLNEKEEQNVSVTIQDQVINLNKTISSLKEEISQKLKDITSLTENIQTERNKNIELEKKIKEEKMMSNLIKDKLHQEKEKNRNLEIKIEQLDEKISDNKSSLNLENKLNELNVKNKELVDLIKKNEEEIHELNSKLKVSAEEKNNLNANLDSIQTELKSNEEKIMDLTLEKELLETIKNKTDTDLSSKEKNISSLNEQMKQFRVDFENLSNTLTMNQNENSNLKTENSKLQAKFYELNQQNELLNTNTQNEIKKLTVTINQLNKDKTEADEKIKLLNEQINIKHQEHKILEKEILSLKEEINSMDKINKTLNESFQKLEHENHKLNEIIQNDKNSLLTQMQSIMKENENLQEIITLIEKEKDHIQDSLDEAQQKLNLKTKEHAELYFEKETIEKNNLELQKNSISVKQQLEKAKSDNEAKEKNLLENLNNQLNTKISDISKLEAEKEKIVEEKILILKGVENLNVMIDSINKEKANYLSEIKTLKEEKEEFTRQSTNFQNEINQHKQKISQISTQNQKHENEKIELLKETQRNKKEIEKLKNDIVEFNNMNDFLKKELTETNRLLNEQIISHKQDLNNSFMQNQEKNKEKLEDKEIEIEKLNKKIDEGNEKIKKFNSLFEEFKEETNRLKEERKNLENTIQEKEEKINKLNSDYLIAQKESKEMKNKLAQFKMEFNSINEEKENELEKIREHYDILTNNEGKYAEYLKNLLLKLSAWEGTKLNVKKNYDMEEDNYDVSVLIDEVSAEVDKLHQKLVEIQKKTEIENKSIESKLVELNKETETKLKEYLEENKRLKSANEEFNTRIIETVREKTPHLIDSKSKGPDDYLKAIELFRLYNEELSKVNSLFEEKYSIALNQAKKYKELYLTTERKMSDATRINPNSHKIITDKILGESKWVLVAEKSIGNEVINYEKTQWIQVIGNKVSEFNLNEFNQFKSENDKNKEISDLLLIQNELISKLAKKDDEISKIKTQQKASFNNLNSATASASVAANQLTNQGNNIGDAVNNSFTSIKIRDSEDNHSKKAADYYLTNKDFYTNMETIPLEKYQKLLDALVEEQEKNRQSKAIIEKLSGEYENIRNILEQNRSKIERQANFSEIKDMKEGEASKFFDEELNMNEMFLNHEIKISEGTRRSIVKTDRNSEIGDREQPHPSLERRNSKESIKTSKRIDTQTSAVNSIRDNVLKLEENEKLLSDQLLKIKEELKDTRNQRDIYKRKYEESITLQNGKKNEIVSMLKQAFEKLVAEIAISNKTKEYITVILKILDYNDNDINRVLKKEKKGFFGIFNNTSGNTK